MLDGATHFITGHRRADRLVVWRGTALRGAVLRGAASAGREAAVAWGGAILKGRGRGHLLPGLRRVEGAWRMPGLRRGEGALRAAALSGAALRGAILLKGAPSLRSGSEAAITVTLAALPCTLAIGDGGRTQTSRQDIEGCRRRGWRRRQGWRRQRGRLRGQQRGRGGENDHRRFHNRARHKYLHARLQLLLGKGRQLLGFASGVACCVGDSGLNIDAGRSHDNGDLAQRLLAGEEVAQTVLVHVHVFVELLDRARKGECHFELHCRQGRSLLGRGRRRGHLLPGRRQMRGPWRMPGLRRGEGLVRMPGRRRVEGAWRMSGLRPVEGAWRMHGRRQEMMSFAARPRSLACAELRVAHAVAAAVAVVALRHAVAEDVPRRGRGRGRGRGRRADAIKVSAHGGEQVGEAGKPAKARCNRTS